MVRSDLVASASTKKISPHFPSIELMHKFINLSRLIRIVARLVCYRVVYTAYCMPVNHVHTCMIYHQIFDGHPIGFCVCTKFMHNAHTAPWIGGSYLSLPHRYFKNEFGFTGFRLLCWHEHHQFYYYHQITLVVNYNVLPVFFFFSGMSVPKKAH